MKRCTRAGLNVTKSCNWRCATCFYRHETGFFTPQHETLGEIMKWTEEAQRRGLDHCVLVGYGEPTFWPYLTDWIKRCKDIGMTTSIITNGTATPAFYESLYHDGLDHIHVSVHGKGEVLNRIAENQIAGEKQAETLKWLKDSGLPWRSNTTLQQLNFQHLEETVDHILEHECRHVVLLGFLPHYGWYNKLQQVAVPPRDLRQPLERCIEKIEQANRWVTLRYHPMCHMKDEYRKYITNANMVCYDPGEWEYSMSGSANEADLTRIAVELGEQVSIKGKPCNQCAIRQHCGGWNHIYAEGFNGAELKAVQANEISDMAGAFQYYFNQNPFNIQFKGYFA